MYFQVILDLNQKEKRLGNKFTDNFEQCDINNSGSGLIFKQFQWTFFEATLSSNLVDGFVNCNKSKPN